MRSSWKRVVVLTIVTAVLAAPYVVASEKQKTIGELSGHFIAESQGQAQGGQMSEDIRLYLFEAVDPMEGEMVLVRVPGTMFSGVKYDKIDATHTFKMRVRRDESCDQTVERFMGGRGKSSLKYVINATEDQVPDTGSLKCFTVSTAVVKVEK